MAIDLSRLRSGSPDSQLAALRALKNEVVGHVQKKEQWVRAGALEPIVRLTTTAGPAQVNGKATEQSQQQPCGAPRLSCDEAVRLLALQLLASFANAGPAFLAPLDAAGVLPAVLGSLCLRSERSQIVLASLRVLGGIADAAAYAPASSPITSSSLADTIFTADRLDAFSRILAQEGPDRDVASQVSIVTKLISMLSRGEHHQSALVACGALDALATRLASFAVAEGHVIPYAEEDARSIGLSSFIPAPAPLGASLADVLSAIAAIITDSSSRACRLLYAPPIIAVFPNLNREWGLSSRRSSDRVELAGLRPTKLKGYEPMDWLLLPYTSAQLRSQPTHNLAFPPLGPPSYRGNLDMNGRTVSKFGANGSGWNPAAEVSDNNVINDADEPESPLIPWLIGQVRSRNDHEALAAASVLTSLFKSGFAYRARETTLSLLVVPKLLQVLAEAEGEANYSDAGSTDAATQSAWNIIEHTPATLARLITDSELLQKAAFEAGAVKSMCKLLKGTYETLPPATGTKFWSPSSEADLTLMDTSPVSKLGDQGQHPLLVHRVRVRENSLRALGALGTFKEDYRKAIVDQDMIQYIKESLQQHPRRPGQSSNPPAALEGDVTTASELGDNPTPVIVAACYAIRMVSRSVNFLRTSLMDSGVAVPLHKLLRHPEIEVQIAATAAVCNLVTDFSPMREVLITAGILKVLCAHAKSQNASLRLNALWALKHLVHSASTDLKKACLEELQSGWLVQLIRDDKEDEALHSAWTRNGFEQASEADDNMDIDDQSRSSYIKSWGERVPAESSLIRKADARLTALRDAECDPVRRARQDDLAIQEQGLGFIRNLIGGAHSNSSADSTNETTEMIDYLFNTLGQDRFFDILVGKLQVKVLHPFSGRRGPAGSEPRVLYPQAKIIEAVVYILVHLAASIPRHRQLVIAQTELLKQLVSLFNSQDREVRVALCHLINNLTWQDDVTDASACSQRAVELKKLGFLSKLESLGQNDDELDVRERARSALWQMKHGH